LDVTIHNATLYQSTEVTAQIVRDCAVTHSDNEWTQRSIDYHLGRAEDHLPLLRDGDQQQDHLALAAARLLMALALREPG
jgi:hypothetical protein